MNLEKLFTWMAGDGFDSVRQYYYTLYSVFRWGPVAVQLCARSAMVKAHIVLTPSAHFASTAAVI